MCPFFRVILNAPTIKRALNWISLFLSQLQILYDYDFLEKKKEEEKHQQQRHQLRQEQTKLRIEFKFQEFILFFWSFT